MCGKGSGVAVGRAAVRLPKGMLHFVRRVTLGQVLDDFAGRGGSGALRAPQPRGCSIAMLRVAAACAQVTPAAQIGRLRWAGFASTPVWQP